MRSNCDEVLVILVQVSREGKLQKELVWLTCLR